MLYATLFFFYTNQQKSIEPQNVLKVLTKFEAWCSYKLCSYKKKSVGNLAITTCPILFYLISG